ncbi:AraC family transcriptional regulator [Pseudoxanthomonas suwonensis]|uniref:AraC family transcriptional regulator n=1 Tax=Pseudoxanthomonas suwonensis TaxID=314722 RepID=UPI000491C431|nr:AraC family transcriptional regulator [Pseudoxanthomonas suwonensis]
MAGGDGQARRGVTDGGRVVMWSGGSLWTSRGTGHVPAHAHHALQLVLSPQRPARVQAGDAWTGGHLLLVPPDLVHAFDGMGADVAMVFVAPESMAGRMLLAAHGSGAVAVLEDARVLAQADALLGLAHGQADASALETAARAIIDLLTGALPGGDAPDPRIGRVLEWLERNADGPLALADAAAVAHLSPSRFRHLFVQHTGVPFRTHVLWTRLNRAVAERLAGRSWTEAAQRSGFADQAHLTRTCRRMFGVAPTMFGGPRGP